MGNIDRHGYSKSLTWSTNKHFAAAPMPIDMVDMLFLTDKWTFENMKRAIDDYAR